MLAVNAQLSSPKPGHTTGESGRGSARQGGRRGGAGQDGKPTGRFAQETTVPLASQRNVDNCPEFLSGNKNKRDPMYTGYRNTTSGSSAVYLSNPKPEHTATRVGAGRLMAGRVRTGRRRIGSPRREPTLLCSRASWTTVLNAPLEERTTFYANQTCRVQNPDIPQVVRGGASHGGAAGRGGAGQDGTPTGRFAQETTAPLALQGIGNNCPECLSGSKNKRNPM